MGRLTASPELASRRLGDVHFAMVAAYARSVRSPANRRFKALLPLQERVRMKEGGEDSASRILLLNSALPMVGVPAAACPPLSGCKGGQAAHGTQ